MSDEPFQMRCQDWFIRYTVSQPGYMIGGAKLPHAQTRMWDGSYMSMWERIETTKEKITFKEDLNSQASWALQINRLTKEVIEGDCPVFGFLYPRCPADGDLITLALPFPGRTTSLHQRVELAGRPRRHQQR